ncbi:MAG: GatB/YqeY domain-containing protein [Actinobacteria bacterium]|nr:GatB/YqeY domain-containing protein [Actinomycetota bacterium]NBY15340.1 GatB/YqeY domain-containing protein [Actinomycetota bacterium]
MNSLKETLQADLNDAMRSKETLTVSTLRMVLAAITNEEVSGKQARELSDQEVVTVLNREAKKRKEASVAYTDASRPELAAQEDLELAVIKKYLPEELSEDELSAIIASAVAEVSASGQAGPSAMGAVMKIVQPQVSGRADGGQVASLVKKLLSE